jgi:predicted nucleic acid-binding protein
VDALLHQPLGVRVTERIGEHRLHAPAHLDLELLSALSRLHRAGSLSTADVERLLLDARATPIERHALHDLTAGAWARRGNLRASDAYYVELADRLDAPLITTDRRLARATPLAELV